jgi:5-methylcytosine-specific restriction endonuclease McrA
MIVMLINPSKQVNRANYRARSRNLAASLTLEEWSQTLIDFDNSCAYCGGPYYGIDHFYPLSGGGGSVAWNCVPCCQTCNELKGSTHPLHLHHVSHAKIQKIQSYLHDRKLKRNQLCERERNLPTPPVVCENKSDHPIERGMRMRNQIQPSVQPLGNGKEIRITCDPQEGQVVLQVSQRPLSEDDLVASSHRIPIALSLSDATNLAQSILRAVTELLNRPSTSTESD